MTKAIRIIAAIFVVGILTFAGIQLGSYVYERTDDVALNDELVKIANSPIEADAEYAFEDPDAQNRLRTYARRLFGKAAPGGSPISGYQRTPSLNTAQRRKINIPALRKTNKDIVAWISIPNMPVDYPVLKGKDNSYYLTRNAAMKRSSAGAIFMDSKLKSDFTSSDTIIYGHDMRDGTKFGSLSRYRNKKFRDTHQYVYVYTPKATLKYRVTSTFRTTAKNLTPDRSSTRTLTLVTCEGKNAHYVVRARLVSSKAPGKR